ncbi:hypothetical protein LguiB_008009 [Lonicera macranthoides]
MATSAFKSTTKRTPIATTSKPQEDSSAGSSHRAHRRSRSLSRFSRMPQPEPDFGDTQATRGSRFVNTVRGSEFPEISLDDLAIHFFPTKDSLNFSEEEDNDRGRSSRRSSEISRSTSTTVSTQRRGRSVSRHNGKGSVGNASTTAAAARVVVPVSNSRRRRSVSVARYQISDSESDIDHSRNFSNHANGKSFSSGNSQRALSQKPPALANRRLWRSVSQKDLVKSYDGYSSQSSALTDDEARDTCFGKKGAEKTIRAVFAQKVKHPIADDMNSGLYEAMRKELRHAVEEIKTELEQATMRTSPLPSGNSDVPQVVSAMTKNYATKLEQASISHIVIHAAMIYSMFDFLVKENFQGSEKRKQDLLAEIVLEEQRGKELSKIVRELLPDSKRSSVAQKPLQSRKRSSDRNRMSKRLTEEAEKYFEDFLSNVEDTDISSFDGERSDASSSLGGITKPRGTATNYGEIETCQNPAGYSSLPVEMEGVSLPWLQWETSNDGSPILSKNKMNPSTQDLSSHTPTSGHGSWSPGTVDSHLVNNGEKGGSKSRNERSRFDVDEYIMVQKKEELLFEIWSERRRISSGGLLLCNQVL